MTEFVRNRDLYRTTLEELLVLSFGNLQSIWPSMHYSFMGATKARNRTFKFHGTGRQLDLPLNPRVDQAAPARLRTAQQTLCNLCDMPTASVLLATLSDISQFQDIVELTNPLGPRGLINLVKDSVPYEDEQDQRYCFSF